MLPSRYDGLVEPGSQFAASFAANTLPPLDLKPEFLTPAFTLTAAKEERPSDAISSATANGPCVQKPVQALRINVSAGH